MAYLKSSAGNQIPKFIRAFGPDDAEGTIDGNYRYHVFNATKTGAEGFRIVTPGNGMGSDTLEYLVIAGGGGGGAQHGGGGGAGGYLTEMGYRAAATSGASNYINYDVTVGAGGVKASGSTNTAAGSPGNDTTFAGPMENILAKGGGGGGSFRSVSHGGENRVVGNGGHDGGSGGGGGPNGNGTGYAGFGGSSREQSGYHGNLARYNGGGGGGAGGQGTRAGDTSYQGGPVAWTGTTSAIGGDGGHGITSYITGSAVMRAGGGGGGSYNSPAGQGAGGDGGGANGANGAYTPSAPTANYGGGGGGESVGGTGRGHNGADGVVILRYRYRS